jgi:hypothetical protein
MVLITFILTLSCHTTNLLPLDFDTNFRSTVLR